MAPAKQQGRHLQRQQQQQQPRQQADSTGTDHSSSKGRLKTSEEVLSFVRTDPRFDRRLVHLVYLDKLRGCFKRCAVADWVPVNQGGDIPLHRVYFFEIRGQASAHVSAGMPACANQSCV